MSMAIIHPSMSDSKIAAMLANNQEVKFVGDFTRTTSLTLLAGHQLYTRGARFLANADTLTLFNAVDADDLEIDHLHMVGTRAGSGSAAQHGLVLKDSRNVRIHALTAKNMKGRGFYRQHAGSYEYSRGIRGQFSNIMLQGNYLGLEIEGDVDCEYEAYMNLNASDNAKAVLCAAGNVSFIGGNITDNVDGMEWVGSHANNTHGKVVGMNITHNSGFSLKVADSNHGQTFEGCHIYGDSSSAGKVIIENSQNVRFNGGILSAYVEVNEGADTRRGKNFLTSLTLQSGFGIAGDASADLVITNCGDNAGMSAANTIALGGSSSGAESLVDALRVTSNMSIPGAQTTLVFNSASVNVASCYNPSTGIFTAPAAGKYLFAVSCVIGGSSITNGGFLTFLKKPSGGSYATFSYAGLIYANTNLACGNGFEVMDLQAGDEVKVAATFYLGATGMYLSTGAGNSLKIFKL